MKKRAIQLNGHSVDLPKITVRNKPLLRALAAIKDAKYICADGHFPEVTLAIVIAALKDEFEPLPRRPGRPRTSNRHKVKDHPKAHTRLFQLLASMNTSAKEGRA